MTAEAAALRALSPEVKASAVECLAAMHAWHYKVESLLWDPAGDWTRGITTGALAKFRRIKPETDERRALQSAMTALRRAGLVHYEYRAGVDAAASWWVTQLGLDVAAKLPVRNRRQLFKNRALRLVASRP